MRNLIMHLLLSLLLVSAGCGKGSEAASKAASRPAPAVPSTARSGPPLVESPSQMSATSVPGADELIGRVDVQVESIDADVFAASVITIIPMSVLIRVTSHQESPRLRVEARRFYIEADKSTKIQARPGASKDPPLPSGYMKAGESVTGWLTFDVPKAAKSLILKSDMRRPPIEVPIALPGLPPGG